MIKHIEAWIDSTNLKYQSQRNTCSIFSTSFSEFYSENFLKDAYFVVVDNIPKPDFPELREAGLGDFMDMEANGITYKNTYYINEASAEDLRVHFHELVHVAQWGFLGAQGFIVRYIHEIQNYGYDNAPLELMAYGLDDHYSQGKTPMDVLSYVRSHL